MVALTIPVLTGKMTMLLHGFSPDMKKLVFVFCVLLALGIAAHYNKETLMAWMSPEKEGTPTPAAPNEAKPVAQPAPAEQPPVEPAVAEVSEEVKALQFAAEGGDAVAQCNLGLCLETGEGIATDAAAAVEMYRKSAEQGNAAACFNLARCYVNGFGVEPDVAQFISWCRKGAEAGNADAMYTLGMCYKQGLGVEASAQEAEVWLRKAADLNHEKAAAELN